MYTSGEGWRLRVLPDADAMSAAAAERVIAVVRKTPRAAIMLPTGNTPLGLFHHLAAASNRGDVDLSQVELYLMDDYLGVTGDDPNSLTGWLQRSLLDRISIDPSHVHAIPAAAANPEEAADAYERELRARGGLDLAVVGLGPNGHVAFNEPGSPRDSRTRVLDLTPESIAQASAYWQGALPIPSQAMTVGVGTLLEAREIVLIVSGQSKAQILRRTLEDPVGPDIPASWMRLAGARLEVLADKSAASTLTQVTRRL